jgi:hypothetical protein
MPSHSGSRKDLVSGGLLTVLGVGYVFYALIDLDIGTAFNMSSGYFPVLLGSVLTLLGLAILVKSFQAERDSIKLPPFRAVAFIIVAPIVFGTTIRGFGLLGATALSTFVAGLASPRISIAGAAAIAIALSLFCVGVFIYGLGLNLPIFGNWLPF